jgi:hypothetical protein
MSQIISQDEKKFRCPVCGEYIRISNINVDFVHKGCSTEWKISGHDRRVVLKHDAYDNLLTGMRTEPGNIPRRKWNTIDREKKGDVYIKL